MPPQQQQPQPHSNNLPDLENNLRDADNVIHEEQGLASGQVRRRGSTDWLLRLGRAANIIAGLSALAALIVHAMALALGNEQWTDWEVASTRLLRLYCIAIAVLCMAVETEWGPLLAQMKVLESWVGRGLLQIFLGNITLQLQVQGDSDFEKSLKLYRQVAGMSMAGCGTFYFLGGLLCLGVCKRSRQRKQMEIAKAENDLKALARKQEELRALLASTSRD